MNQPVNNNQPVEIAGFSRRNFLARLLPLPLAVAVLGTLPVGSSLRSQTLAPVLSPGDILYSDSGDAIGGACIFKLDSRTGQVMTLAQGQYLGFFGYPIGIAVDANNQLIVANEQCLLHIDPGSRQQTVMLTVNQVGAMMWGVAVADNGDFMLATERSILRMDPAISQTDVVATNGYLTHALHLALGGENNQEIFVTNDRFVEGIGLVGQILRINPHSGEQKVIAEGGYLTSLRAITVSGRGIYVACCVGHDSNFGVGRVVHIDSHTGKQDLISEAQFLAGPSGIAVDQDGQLLVTDPYTGLETYDATGSKGALIRIDPATGDQTLVLQGHGSSINPEAVTVVPSATQK